MHRADLTFWISLLAMGAAPSQLAQPLPTAETAVAARPSLELAVCCDAGRTPGSAVAQRMGPS